MQIANELIRMVFRVGTSTKEEKQSETDTMQFDTNNIYVGALFNKRIDNFLSLYISLL